MCGIFGFTCSQPFRQQNTILPLLADLFLLSELRGKEASGLVLNDGDQIKFVKVPFPASDLVRNSQFRTLISSFASGTSGFKAVIGHSRLVTDGYEHDNRNNQPVVKGNTLAVHNGIIVNHRELWKSLSDEQRVTELDSEIIPAWVSNRMRKGYSAICAVRELFAAIKGMTSMAMLFDDQSQMLMATNNGSLYYASHPSGLAKVFASERHILSALFDKHFGCGFRKGDICQLKPNSLLVVHLADASAQCIEMDSVRCSNPEVLSEMSIPVEEIEIKINRAVPINRSLEHDVRPIPRAISKFVKNRLRSINSLNRCRRCILPETFPFIEFDETGECNYCRNHKPLVVKGEEAFRTLVSSYSLKSGGTHDCLLPFSGGRDSSFALHYMKRQLGMNPLAYSYDWGMLTDLARRNQARMCGELGVEHILISADIRKKRENIRKNVLAWMKSPHLGSVPLFMAGDKQYFYYSNLLLQQNEISLAIMGENMLETTRFKTGFCGISPHFDAEHTYSLRAADKLKLLFFYGKQYLLNPAFFNASLIDTLKAFRAYYFMQHESVNIFDYLPWREKEIENVLISQYDWETDPETKTTWRIGDGTAAFYNYIYLTVAGFTENDTFRSNQVRQGHISREEALHLSARDNQPRWGSVQWYCNVIGIDWEKAISTINKIKPLLPHH